MQCDDQPQKRNACILCHHPLPLITAVPIGVTGAPSLLPDPGLILIDPETF